MKINKQPAEPINWRQIFIEFFAVVFGVLLGLILNEWRVDTRQAEAVEQAMTTLQAEIQHNYDTVIRARDYHLSIYADLRAISKGTMTFAESQFRGVRPPLLQTAAYKIALQRGVFADIDQQRAVDIVRAYTRKEAFMRLAQSYANGMIENMGGFSNDEEGGKLVLSAISDFLFTEDQLLDDMAVVLDKNPVAPWYQGIEDFSPGVEKAR